MSEANFVLYIVMMLSILILFFDLRETMNRHKKEIIDEIRKNSR